MAAKNIGEMYMDGKGVPQDLNQAAYWLNKAVNLGDVDAQQALSELVNSGIDLRKGDD